MIYCEGHEGSFTDDGREKVSFGRGVLTSLGESAIEYEVVYTVLDPSYDVYAEIHQQIFVARDNQRAIAQSIFVFDTQTRRHVGTRTWGQVVTGKFQDAIDAALRKFGASGGS